MEGNVNDTEDNINNYIFKDVGYLQYAEAKGHHLFLTKDRKRYVTFPMSSCDFEKGLGYAVKALCGKV